LIGSPEIECPIKGYRSDQQSHRLHHDLSGNVLSRTDPNGGTTTLAYDVAGQLTTVTDPRGNVTVFAYDNNGNRILTSDPMQNNTTSAYNYRGQATDVTDALGARITMAGGLGNGFFVAWVRSTIGFDAAM